MKIVKTSRATRYNKHRVVAADEDTQFDDFTLGDADNVDSGLSNQLDNMQDQIEDIQDSVDDIAEDSVNIDLENNIAGHYIAECERCKGIFISAVVESDQKIESVSGICPLCDEETTQWLRWKIIPAEESADSEVGI